jgi:hypothetical protein
VSFTKTSGGADHTDVEKTKSSALDYLIQIDDLVVGTYTITVKGYKATADTVPYAIGTKAGVVVSSGENQVDIVMAPNAGDELEGELSYAGITISTEVASAQLIITTPAGDAVAGVGPVDLLATPANIPLPAGYYRAQVVLTKEDGRSAGFIDIFHIYGMSMVTNLTTRVFTNSDFTAGGSPPSLKITVKRVDYTQTLPIGGSSGSNTIIQGGSPSSLTLAAPAGYSNVAWYIDGDGTPADTPADTPASITLNAGEYGVGLHLISFTGIDPAGRYQSQIVAFTVETSDSSRVIPEKLADYLDMASVGTADEPTTVTLAPFDILSNDLWGTTIKNALAASTKYVKLDLSACIPLGTNRITADDFSIIKTDYIVGVIPPFSITNIGNSAFAGWTTLKMVTIPPGVNTLSNSAFANTGLTSIVIPEAVTSIGNTCFNECSSLVSVTFKGNGVSSLSANQFPGNLHTVYNNSSNIPKAGTYVSADNGATWTK